MQKMGFADRWTQLIMSCVRSVFYSAVINGKQVGNSTPSRGLRQGDPLFPYLFLLCVEGLVSMMKEASRRGVVKRIAATKGGPKVANLFFANDSLFFYCAKKMTVGN